MAGHKCSKETEIEIIKNDMKHQSELIKDIHKAIVGNGKPGLKSDVQEIKIEQESQKIIIKKHMKILDKLNLRMAYYGGGIAMLTIGLTFAINYYK